MKAGALQALVATAGEGPSIGLELPLDNDWSPAGDTARRHAGRPFGVPDIAQHARLVKLADRLGFRALWARDVPLYARPSATRHRCSRCSATWATWRA